MEKTHPIQVLLLEDHGIVRAGLKALLKETAPNTAVYEAADYDQAVALLSAVLIDFAFLDIHLSHDSGKTGLDVLHYIRAQILPTRTVMLSVYDDEATVMKCARGGVRLHCQGDEWRWLIA